MRFTANAGHNPDNKTACGAVGLIKESTENRKVVKEMSILSAKSEHTLYDTTVDDGTSQNDVLDKILNLTKRYDVDLHVSVHFNSGAKDEKGNGKTTGVEVLVYEDSGVAGQKAKAVCDSIAKLGFKNRGVKEDKRLAFLRKTKGPAILIECCFVDDLDDCKLYNPKAMAKAIMEGLTGDKFDKPLANDKKEYEDGDYNRKARVVNAKDSGLNVRKERGVTTDEPVKKLPEGTIITVSYCKDNWFSTYDVKYNNKPCYVSGAYIELI